MTDKELLELAAKAAGAHRVDNYGHWRWALNGAWWNPLTDDGDALRLAVKLGLSLVCPSSHSMASARAWLNPSGDVKTNPVEDDPYAATRRAIVRAAAEIGKEMK